MFFLQVFAPSTACQVGLLGRMEAPKTWVTFSLQSRRAGHWAGLHVDQAVSLIQRAITSSKGSFLLPIWLYPAPLITPTSLNTHTHTHPAVLATAPDRSFKWNAAFVFCGCITATQTQQLRTTPIYFLSDPMVRTLSMVDFSPLLRVSQGCSQDASWGGLI